MKTSLDQGDREFLGNLHRHGAASVQELCARLGVTATAVRQRLTRLQGLGLVERQTVRAGRGRPHHAYRVTDAGLRQLGDNYSDLALVLWRELRQIDDPQLRARIASRVRDALADQFGQWVDADAVRERLEQLQKNLSERGFSVEVDSSGALPILREHNCPYQELASSDPGICELEQEVFQRVLGVPVTLTQRCRDGHHCCEFQAGGVQAGG